MRLVLATANRDKAREIADALPQFDLVPRPDEVPDVEPGSIEYSAVTHPLPRPRIHGGTRSSTDAVHSTLVRPIETSTDPMANSV